MRKIPTLFDRDESRRFVIDKVTPGCEWVLAGEGEPTRKYDGACCMIDEDGKFWKRREVKEGQKYPEGFVSVEVDPNTGKYFGWVPVGDGPADRWFREAYENVVAVLVDLGNAPPLSFGAYEMVGPRVNGNPEGYEYHWLVQLNALPPLPGVPRTFTELANYMPRLRYEGIVWHHPDGRMVKLKRRDFPKERAA